MNSCLHYDLIRLKFFPYIILRLNIYIWPHTLANMLYSRTFPTKAREHPHTDTGPNGTCKPTYVFGPCPAGVPYIAHAIYTCLACVFTFSPPCIARDFLHACSIYTSMHLTCTLVVTVVLLCMCRAADISAAAVLLSAFSFGKFFSPPPPQLCHLCTAGLRGAAPPCITFVRFFRSLRLHSIGIARRSRLLERLHRTSFI